jgi:hypothetical protein
MFSPKEENYGKISCPLKKIDQLRKLVDNKTHLLLAEND